MSDTPIVAITGATGFLGLHLVAALARAGIQSRILARRPPAHEFWRGLSFDVVNGSLEDRDALDRLVSGADVVIHAAGLIKARDRAAFFRTNADGSRLLAERVRARAPGARLIAVSSLAAREPDLSDYAASKRAGEDAARAVYADAPRRLTVVRPPMIYGPWDRETLTVFKTAARPLVPLVGSGRLAAIHVSDAAAALGALVFDRAGRAAGGTYALADTRPAGYTMAEMLCEAARATGRTTPPHFLKIPDALLLTAGWLSSHWGTLRGSTPIFTAGKAREICHPDWTVSPGELLPANLHRSTIGLAEGFRQTVRWYREAGWLPGEKPNNRP